MTTGLSSRHTFGSHCRLGESPIWDCEEQALYWVDNKQSRVHRLDWRSRQHRIYELDVVVTAIAPRARGGFVTPSTTGLYAWNRDFTEKQFLVDPCRDIPNVRLNDAVVDRAGRLWTGSLNERDLPAPDGSLYRLDANHALHRIDGGFSVANGITFGPLGDRLYVSNMLKGEVLAYDLDAESGRANNRRVYVRNAEGAGFPDGLTVDVEGYVWIGHWKGRRVTRHHPDSGEVVAEVELPVTNVTRATFGGKDLDELIVTTAWHGVECDLPNQPFAGDLFSIRVPVPGFAEMKYLG
jgi:sugar lactone lactonase YvrE